MKHAPLWTNCLDSEQPVRQHAAEEFDETPQVRCGCGE
jgi:hypothetical protein